MSYNRSDSNEWKNETHQKYIWNSGILVENYTNLVCYYEENEDKIAYVLELSSAKEFCSTHPNRSSSLECREDFNLVLHGLWPNFCNIEKTYNINRDDIINILDKLPNARHIAPEYFDEGHNLALHEWEKHGRCSGLDPESYFEIALTLCSFLPNPKISLEMERSELERLFPGGELKFDNKKFKAVRYKFDISGNVIYKHC